jgi:succinate dehydrogenase/fumarate reductase flavoprotein subunit
MRRVGTKIRDVSSDVLVIGGGSAASRAALEAKKAGAEVLMVMKGEYGKCGTSAFRVAELAGFNVADGQIDSRDNPDEHLKDVLVAGLGMCDQKLARILVDDALRTVPDLEELGVRFEREGSRYLTTTGCFATRPRMHIIKDHAVPIVQALKRGIEKLGVTVLENVMIIRLIVQAGICVGAVGIDRAGELYQFRAKAVVLGAGGAGQLFAMNLNPPDITGDGYALGLDAGAELINMEYMQAGFGLVWPVKMTFNSWNLVLRPKLSNSLGREFLHLYLPKGVSQDACYDDRMRHYPFSTRDRSCFMDIAVKKEIESGRGTEHRGVFLDYRSAEKKDIQANPSAAGAMKLWDIFRKYLLQRGHDPGEKLLQISCFGHAINGGLKIDEWARTTVKGLWAAGECAGGPHGADRLGGNMLLTCQVFGTRAGKSAANEARQSKLHEFGDDILKEIEYNLSAISSRKGSIPPASLKHRLQRAMERNILVIKSEKGLKGNLRELEGIKNDLTEEVLVGSPADVWAVFELRNLLLVGEAISQAALQREESRGSFYREDFPQQVDNRFLRISVSRKVNGETKTDLVEPNLVFGE